MSCLFCLIAIVVPKGSTIDHICGPRDSYEVTKRILLTSRPIQKGGVAKGDSQQVESSALAPKALINQSDKPQPPSYVTRQEPVGRAQPLATISTTLPWTKNEDGLGSQMPQPVKLASLKDNDDVPMDDAECLEGAGHMDCDMGDSKREGNKQVEPKKTEQEKEPHKLIPVTKEVVTAQASPLKSSSQPASKPLREDLPTEGVKLSEAGAACVPNQKPSAGQKSDEVLVTALNGTLPLAERWQLNLVALGMPPAGQRDQEPKLCTFDQNRMEPRTLRTQPKGTVGNLSRPFAKPIMSMSVPRMPCPVVNQQSDKRNRVPCALTSLATMMILLKMKFIPT